MKNVPRIPYTFFLNFIKKLPNPSTPQSLNNSITQSLSPSIPQPLSLPITLNVTVILICLFGIVRPATGQQVRTYISDDSLQAGDLVMYSITLIRGEEYDQIIFPDTSYFNQNFELRERRRYRVADFKDSLAYLLQFWGVNDVAIPSLPVKLVSGNDTTTVYTRPISIVFQSVLQSENPDLRPLKPIFEFARAWWLYILIILLLIIAAAIAWYYYKKRQEQPVPAPPPEFKQQPFLNPLRELENNLRQLKNVPESKEPNLHQFYIDLGDAIRLYFEQMYHIPALESTSGEVLAELNRRGVDDNIIDDTRAVLNEADLVKFAKFEPTQEQAKKAFQKAEGFHSTVKAQHQNRIKMMRRQHFEKVEQERRAFIEAQKQEETV